MSLKPKEAVLLVLLFTVSALAINWFVNYRADQKRHREAMEEAKKSFLSQASLKYAPIDSIYATGDSVVYYRNDTLIGTSVVTVE
jgi:hypothetical protein